MSLFRPFVSEYADSIAEFIKFIFILILHKNVVPIVYLQKQHYKSKIIRHTIVPFPFH